MYGLTPGGNSGSALHDAAHPKVPIKVDVTPVDAQIVEDLVRWMRPADMEEIGRYTEDSPVAHLMEQVERSIVCRAGFVNGELLACWGLWPINLLQGVGHGWCYSAKAVERYPKTFFARCKVELAELQRVCPLVVACVDLEYTRARAWLERLGFVERTQRRSPRGHPFVLMEARRHET